MTSRQLLLGGLVIIWLVLIALAVSFCSVIYNNPSGPYQQFGRQMGTRHSQRADVKDYKYVADPVTMQYWPNLPQYVDKIKGDPVWILDDETLAQFKGYKPGPL